MTELFRERVLSRRQASYLGSIRLGRNPGFTAVAVVAVAISICLVSYGYWGQVTRKATLTGMLIPTEGTLTLSATQPGTLIDVLCREGETVTAGQVLMRVDVDHSTSHGSTAMLVGQALEQRKLALQAQRQLAADSFRQRQMALGERIRSLEGAANQSQTELVIVGNRIALAQKTVDTYNALAQQKFYSDMAVQEKLEALLDLRAKSAEATRTLITAKADAQGARDELLANKSSFDTQLSQLDIQLSSLQQEQTENQARGELVLVAPQAGTVTAIPTYKGQAVQGGQTLLVLVPQSPTGGTSKLQAHLFAPSRTAGFVQPGQPVWIRYSAYAYQKFGMAHGIIESVSRTPISPQDLPTGQGAALLASAQSQEAMYRVTVALDQQDITTYGQVQPLRPGMTLDADVVQERRRIWEWMLEPVIAASGFSKNP